jgi:diguanylate cyclase (GGDEF)-like protein
MVEAAAFDMSQAQRYLVLVNQLKQAIAAPPQDRSDRSYIEGAEPASKLRQNRFLDAEHYKLSEQGLTYDRDHWGGKASVVLMIDIEPSVVDAFRPLAAAQALQLVAVSDSVEAQNWLKQHSPRCTVVSLRQVLRMMDRDSGLESLKADDDSPVIALANRNTLEDRRIATNAGCDRYLLTSSPPEILVEAIVEAIAQKSANVAARVMIVDDDPLALKAFMTLLQPWGLQVICLSNPEQFWTVLTATHPDMILLDLEMPHFSGLELCRIVRQDMRYGDIPILVVTAHADMDTLQRAFEAGADDFIHKPIVGPELISRMICRLERIRLQHHRPSIRQNGSTPEQNESIPNALTQITLTQIANQQDFHDYLTQEWQRLGDRYAFLSLILCGIDDFDQYCDRHGSLAGDLALRQIAQVIQQCAIFRLDLVAHYKQDIFAVVLPETDLTGALRVGERIRQAIEEKYLSERDSSSPMPDGEIQGLTLSLGITGTIPNPAQTLHDFIAIADQALYAAKTKGGNTYCLYPL